SSLAGAPAEIVGFDSPSGALAAEEGPGRSKVEASGGTGLGFRTGVAIAFAGASAGGELSTVTDSSSSVRFNALSIADIAAETGSVAGFCFAIAWVPLHRRRPPNSRPARPTSGSTALGRTNRPRINHVAVYRRAVGMKTAPPAHLENVVNASVTMFFHN